MLLYLALQLNTLFVERTLNAITASSLLFCCTNSFADLKNWCQIFFVVKSLELRLDGNHL